jgi:hypothetical protein
MVKKMFPARYASQCPLCGNRIAVGTMIEKRNGEWAHAKCPTLVPKAAKAEITTPAKPVEVKPLFPPIPNVPMDEVITLFYSEGEYLSGYMPMSRSDELESIGLAHSVSGWGTHFDANGKDFKPVLGEKFTWAQAVAYITPLRAAAEQKHAAKLAASDQKEADAFARAKATGERVPLRSWSEECNDSREECNVDNLTEYALPDGHREVVRSHTW